MLNPTEILRNARELILDRDHWCVRALATDSEYNECEPDDPQATCFCAEGAICRVGIGEPSGSLADAVHLGFEIATQTALSIYGEPLHVVNDRWGHKAVLEVLTEAIKRCES